MNLSSMTSLLTGVQTLRANPLRTVLSTLGVIIGVAALVAILALGDGLEAFSREQIETTTDLQFITVTPRTVDRADGILVRREDVETFAAADARALDARLVERATATLHMTGSTYARLPDDSVRHATFVEATLPGSAVLSEKEMAAGRLFTDADGDDVVVLSDRLARALGADGGALVGRTLLLGDLEVRVLGVLAPEEDERILRAFTPVAPAVVTLLGGVERRPPGLVVHVGRIEDVQRTEADVRTWLAERFGSADGFTVASSRARVEQTSRAVLVFKLAMGSITGISILVGGIGIMNILLASVHERTREIGVRRAAGARQRDIFLQFLAESVLISAAGALLGVVVGMAAAFGITAVIRAIAEAPVHAAFNWMTVLVAAAIALLVGLAFGTYPARYAARLSPIDAIRHE